MPITQFEILVAALPVVFMIHDFEEIIFFKPFLRSKGEYLRNRFPILAEKFLSHYDGISTSAYALAVAEEFLIISAGTFYSIITRNFYPWFCLYVVFSIHLIIHIVQWIAIRIYVPTIITSFLSLPYCVYVLMSMSPHFQPTILGIILSIGIGVPLIFINLVWIIGAVKKIEYIKD